MLASCHNDLWNSINDLQKRVEKLEALCNTLNTNIDALQTVINAQSSGDMISNVSEITHGNSVIGYTITFKSGKSITLYNGTNGKDGANGQDGYTPSIGVAKDTDGIYYWTLDGTWLLDADGNKLPVTGAKGDKGDKGDTGKDGENGKDGSNGLNGNTPQLKIMDGYWYLSYDGTNWNKLGKAIGESGYSTIKSVTQDNDYVYFTLADGTLIKIAKSSSGSTPSTDTKYTIVYDANGGTGTMAADSIWYQKSATIKANQFAYAQHIFINWNTKADGTGTPFVAGEIIVMQQNVILYAQWTEGTSGEFYVSNTTKVTFSAGNLQYHAKNKVWRFAEHQYDYIGDANSNISSSYDGWIDLFGWGTGNNPTNTSDGYYDSFTTGEHNDYTTFVDWGTNTIDVYAPNTWRTLTTSEWRYLFTQRPYATQLYGFATINDTSINVEGIIILPNNWVLPYSMIFNSGTASYSNNTYTLSQWAIMESAGAVFLPAAGDRNGQFARINSDGNYWSSTAEYGTRNAFDFRFSDNNLKPHVHNDRYYGEAVRLVKVL